MRPINTVVIGRLYFNKTLFQFEDCLRRMLTMAQASGIVSHLHIETTEGMAVDMARDRIVEQALTKHNADAVIWLDTDMIYPDHALVRLIELSNLGYPIVAGLYRRAIGEKNLLCYRTVNDIAANRSAPMAELRANTNEHGVVPVALVAGGFSIVRNEVYQATAYYSNEGQRGWYCNWDFLFGGGSIGEDSFFVKHASSKGFKPVTDPELHAVHWPPLTNPVPVEEGDPLLRWCESRS
jgi:hypothetical protein